MLRWLSSSSPTAASSASSAVRPGMVKTLEKYQRCSYGATEAHRPLHETQSRYQEYLKVKARVELLQHSQRKLLGEDVGSLNTKELEQLEHQLEFSLNRIRSTKTQMMLDQLTDLHNKYSCCQTPIYIFFHRNKLCLKPTNR
ncbi:unnamed protein product [Linum tenue]|uniref:K-box domain-containing protein n=1 Tax=Linum tenue TaxID=586396 RepID=A0AAV0MM53_9ROSI|nr:unnamed protein product [Linum tenue]